LEHINKKGDDIKRQFDFPNDDYSEKHFIRQ
jgi:hypothetical protein